MIPNTKELADNSFLVNENDLPAEEYHKWEQKYQTAVQFLEYTEALTKDEQTAEKIREYLKQELIW